jgi:hypothetical protein
VKNLIAALALTLAATSCQKAESRTAVTAATDAAAGSPQAESRAVTATVPRMIVRTADMHIVAADTARAVEAVTRSAEAMGGYVAGSNVWREGELLRASVTLRVPSSKLSATLSAIRGVATRVERETVSSEEVTQEYVDLGSQVRNLEAAEEELRQLLVVARQNTRKASEVLEVHQQLVAIRGQIEQAKGRMRYLEQTTSMSAIALSITPEPLTRPVVEGGWQPLVVAEDALRSLLALLQHLATAAIWLVIYVLPIVAMLGAVALLVRRLGFRSA